MISISVREVRREAFTSHLSSPIIVVAPGSEGRLLSYFLSCLRPSALLPLYLRSFASDPDTKPLASPRDEERRCKESHAPRHSRARFTGTVAARDALAAPADWVFASPKMKGKKPYWGNTMVANHLRVVAAKAGITGQVGGTPSVGPSPPG
jgi:hypothetical protein